MDRTRLSKQIAYLILVIFVLFFLALKFYWFTSIWFFDMPMHFLGGAFLGLVTLRYFWPAIIDTNSIVKIMLSVLMIGMGWELFEFAFFNHLAQNAFNVLDTLSDICFDLAGGFVAILYFSKNKI